ncbi:16717_t:CDS:1, partial [Racocetra fulgida]
QNQQTITKFTLKTFTTSITTVFPGYSTVVTDTQADGSVASYTTYVPPSTVVLLQVVTGAVADDATDALGISGSNTLRNSGLCGITLSLIA